MFGSFRIGTLAGIPIRVHVLFVLLVAAFAWSSRAGAFEIAVIAMLVACVVLHELGHALVARRFGVRVVDITLWPLGGMARLAHIPESSRVEAWIAIAGPAVNVVLALAAAPFALAATFASGAATTAGALLYAFVVINAVMAGFNLLPAFPTDGGRLVRAWYARKRSWEDATARAVWIGRAVALVLAIAGVVWGNWMLPIVALWLWWAGGIELAQVRARRGAPPVQHAAGATGYSDADLARIESFRGPLRAFDGDPRRAR